MHQGSPLHNDWRLLAPTPLGSGAGELFASVIVPYYQQPEALDLTLAALARQTHPRFEVIVVDDGSVPPLTLDPEHAPGLRVVHQDDRGFGLARARNTGAAAARGDALVFLDADMVPEPDWLEAHVRWHEVDRFALTLGFRHHVEFTGIDADDVRNCSSIDVLVAGRPWEAPEWIERHMGRTDDLTSQHDDLFRVVTGGNLGVGREVWEAAGGFDESFTQWGAEDTEFGYRAWVRGATLVPERAALAWHQGLGTEPDAEERRSLRDQRAKIGHLIAHPSFRGHQPGRTFTVPRLVVEVSVEADVPTSEVVATVSSVLAGDFTDLVVLLDLSPDHPDGEWLAREFGPDLRVLLAETPESASAPLLLSLPPGLVLSPGDVGGMVEAMGGHDLLETPDHTVCLVRSRALHRAARLGGNDPIDVVRSRGVTGTLPADIAGPRTGEATPAVKAARSTARLLTRFDRRFQRVEEQLAMAGNAADVRRTLGWAARNYRNSRRTRGRVRLAATNTTGEPINLDGTVIGATAPFPGLPAVPVIGRLPASPGRIDLLVGSHPGEGLVVEARRSGVPTVLVSELDPPDLLPPIGGPPGAHRAEHDVVGAAARGEAAFDPAASPAVLGEPLAEAVSRLRDPSTSDPVEVDLWRARARTAAWRLHSSEARVDRLRRAAGLSGSLPTVTVLLASRRPNLVERAVQAALGQDYPDLTIVVGLHGDDFAEVDLPGSVAVVRAGSEVVFGDLLNRMARVAPGEFLTKMDDDDWYSPGHVWDLVAAHLESGADLVGKAAEFVHLEREDVTVRRYAGGGGRPDRLLAGGALMVDRDRFFRVGGFRPIAREVDTWLIDDVLSTGGRAFRAPGFGYILRRGTDHTWTSSVEEFLAAADQSWPGVALNEAGVT